MELTCAPRGEGMVCYGCDVVRVRGLSNGMLFALGVGMR